MMKMKTLSLARVGFVAMASLGIANPTHGGMPVFDAPNFSQNLVTATESVVQTLKLIQQYDTQLQQYKNQLQNTATPSAYIWDRAQVTIGNLLTAVNTLNYYKAQLGSLDNYLSRYQDVNYYRNSPCFSPAGCSPAEWAALNSVRGLASESQKRANDALMRGLDLQQTNLQNDAATLQRLQVAAQGANGQMQAIGYANQLASQQANQLMQIRGLLIAQQNAVAARMQAEADREAQHAAAAAQLRRGTFRASPPKEW